jgi:sodium bicarbonate transporter 10
MESSPGEEEGPKDPAAKAPGPLVSDQEISGHRHHYVGFHMPSKRGHGQWADGMEKESNGHGNGRNGHRHHKPKHLKAPDEDHRPVTPPAQRVQFILGEEGRLEPGHETHPVFSEMEELFTGEDGMMEWKETARWVKFEEDVEEGGNRWSKPHVATLSLHSLFELRSFLLNGTVCLDMNATSLEEIADLTIDRLINCGSLPDDKKEQVKAAILKRHRHQFEGLKKQGNENGSGNNMAKLPIIRSLADIGKVHSSSKSNSTINPETGLPRNKSDDNVIQNGSDPVLEHKVNSHFMKKIPKGAEASNILVGEVDFLDKPLSAFIRLQEATILGDLTEVPVPTRFLFVLLGPFGGLQRYHEIGRAVATVMSDEIFHDVAYKAMKRDHLLAGLDEFLDAVTVLPPGEWDPSIRIEPPSNVPSQEGRRKKENPTEKPIDEEEEEAKLREESGLTRTGRFCGGLINDIKRKKPWFISDFKDALSLQCVASYFFIYFACLTPIITFGGLLGDATKNNMASMESLVSGMICGVLFGLFSGQPLTILGSTGPVLVFETIVFDFCASNDLAYLPFRLCIGLWIGVILLILVATDASAFVCYITRFTEENFATLIAVIFIIKAIEKLFSIEKSFPISPSPCFCQPDELDQVTGWNFSQSLLTVGDGGVGVGIKQACTIVRNSTSTDSIAPEVISGYESVGCHYVPNAFLMSCLIFIFTFLISFHLKKFKSQNFFPAIVRSYISDFAVVIAIVSMTIMDIIVGVDTPKLSVPDKFAPTLPTRDWLIHPLGGNPAWTAVVAVVPAILGSILIFMDQQITAVIVNRKEHKLLKGGGYHLDLLIVAICIVVNSILGIPWFVAATVLSINHVRSLTRESECAAPGEKPQFLGIREQRVTHILIFITVGLSVFMTPLLSKIPMPVLYGVFLYMGVASLNGLQFFDRILLILMPKKYQPDYPYLRQVQLNRVHMFTMVQVACFIALWLVKSFKQTSILFPIMLVFMIGIRKALDLFFTKKELQVLDDILPEFKRHKRLDDEEALNLDDDVPKGEGGSQEGADGEEIKKGLKCTKTSLEVPLYNGNVLKIPHNAAINITEEMNKSGCWKSLEENSSAASLDKAAQRKKSGRKMSLVKEEEDEGITIKSSSGGAELGNEDEKKRLVDDGETCV